MLRHKLQMVSFLQQRKLFRAFWFRRPAAPFGLRAYSFGRAPGPMCVAFRAAAPRLFQSWRGPRRVRSFSTLLPAAWVGEYLLQAEAGTASVWEHLQRERSWFVCRPPLGRFCRAHLDCGLANFARRKTLRLLEPPRLRALDRLP